MNSPSTTPHLNCFRNQGFQIRFSNGYTVSVQFGHFHYCASRDLNVAYDAWRTGDDTHFSPNAEVAVMDPNGNFLKFDSCTDHVRGHTDPDTVGKIITWVSNLKPQETA